MYKKGIGLNALQDAQDYKHKHVYVIGGSDGAAKEALYLSTIASKVSILHLRKPWHVLMNLKRKYLKQKY